MSSLIWGDLVQWEIDCSSIVVERGLSKRDESGSMKTPSYPFPKSIDWLTLLSRKWTEEDHSVRDTSELNEDSY